MMLVLVVDMRRGACIIPLAPMKKRRPTRSCMEFWSEPICSQMSDMITAKMIACEAGGGGGGWAARGASTPCVRHGTGRCDR